ncbi:MAG: DUF3786 domain-containing protein [Peptococcaceae bacterium]|nr:DUF3786 domain-containing protein [Peptococcaceae bacterium]
MALINLNPAHDKARAEFSVISPLDAARRAAVRYDQDKGIFRVPFLGREYLVSFPDGEITLDEGGEDVPLTERVCILHYLVRAGDVGLAGRYVTFKDLPNGSIYVGPFNNRAVRPLVSVFGSRPEMLVMAGEKLGGTRVDVGDWAVTVGVFPKVPITFVIWEGDDEFPPSGNILYDASAPYHLETEDYALLPGLTIFAMKKLAGL